MGTYKAAADMVDLYVDLINKFPSIIALIDPFRKEVTGFTFNFVVKQNKSSFFGICHSKWVVIWTGSELLYFSIYEKRHLLSK